VLASSGQTPDHDRRPLAVQAGYASADLSAGDAAGIVVPLAKPVDVSGKVIFEGETARVRRSGMVVQTSPVGQRFSYVDGRPPYSSVEDDSSFKLLRVFRVPLIVRMNGLPDGWVVKSVLYDGRDVTYVPTDFGDPRPARLEIVLTRRIAQALVRVQDERGTPTAAAGVVALPADPSRWLPFAIVNAISSEAGSMKLGPMLPGEYFVAALSRDDVTLLFRESGRVEQIPAVGTRVTFAEGDAPALELRIVPLPAR
jgi:hypothetical protein